MGTEVTIEFLVVPPALPAFWNVADTANASRAAITVPPLVKTRKAVCSDHPVVTVEYQGRIQTITEWAAEFGVSYTTLWRRLNRGWTMEQAARTKKFGRKPTHRKTRGLLNVSEAARHMGVLPHKLYALIRQGRVPKPTHKKRHAVKRRYTVDEVNHIESTIMSPMMVNHSRLTALRELAQRFPVLSAEVEQQIRHEFPNA